MEHRASPVKALHDEQQSAFPGGDRDGEVTVPLPGDPARRPYRRLARNSSYVELLLVPLTISTSAGKLIPPSVE